MPLIWAHVKKGLHPSRFKVRSVPGLLGKSRAWREYCDCERPLAEAMNRLRSARKA
jgi:bifunctional non-homologous end joining protein LigD